VLESYALWKSGHSCWIGDLDLKLTEYAGIRLPLPDQWNANTLKELKTGLYARIILDMETRIRNLPRLFLLHDRLEPQEDPSKVPAKIGVVLRHYLHRVTIPTHRRALTKLIFGEDQYRVNFLHAVPLESRLCRKCARHLETPGHVLLQCPADLLTCALRKQLLHELRSRFAINVPTYPTDDYADFCLKRMIFHWEAVPLTARYIYRVHEMWCGKGKVSFPFNILGDTPLESFDMSDASGSDYNSEGEDEQLEYD
jgi:hypothetical protein